jgi:Holliday junction resolvase RusA-like endonuclease
MTDPTSIGFYVPVRVQPKQSFTYASGRGRSRTNPKVLKNAKTLAGYFEIYKPREPWDGPIALGVQLRFKRNSKHQVGHWYWSRGSKSGDTDNRIKQVKDVLGKCGFFLNDAQVCSLSASQSWADKDGVDITLTQLEEDG